MNEMAYYLGVGLSLAGVALSFRCKRESAVGEPPALRFASNAAVLVGFGLFVYGFVSMKWWQPLAGIGAGIIAANVLAIVPASQTAIAVALGCCLAGIVSATYAVLF